MKKKKATIGFVSYNRLDFSTSSPLSQVMFNLLTLANRYEVQLVKAHTGLNKQQIKYFLSVHAILSAPSGEDGFVIWVHFLVYQNDHNRRKCFWLEFEYGNIYSKNICMLYQLIFLKKLKILVFNYFDKCSLFDLKKNKLVKISYSKGYW